MRSRYRLVLTAILAVLAVSAVASASASASRGFKVNNKAFTGTETITTKLSSSTLSFELNFGASNSIVTVSCTGVSAPGGKITESFKFGMEKLVMTGCKPVKGGNCKFANKLGEPTETLESEALTGEVVEEAGKYYVKLKPAGQFMTIRFGESCAGLGAYTVNAELRCAVATSTEEVTKACEFTATSGSSVKLGTGPSGDFLGTFGLALSGANKGLVWGVS